MEEQEKMIDLEQFTELAAALAYLQAAGFTQTFHCTGNQVRSLETKKAYDQDQFYLVACHRFRYGTQHAQRVVLYAIESANGEKGVVLDDCQSYGDASLGDFLVNIKMCQLPLSPSHSLPQQDQAPISRRAS